MNSFAQSGPRLFVDKPNELSPRLTKYLEHWLVGARPVEGESKDRWYLAANLTEENRAFFQSKARSILGELYFSAKIAKAGLKIFDVRRSRSRAYGSFYILDRIGLLEVLKNARRRLKN
jgi:hypothetical protein